MKDIIDLLRERRDQTARELAKLDAALVILIDDGAPTAKRAQLDGDMNVILAPDTDDDEAVDAGPHCVWCRRTFKSPAGLGRHKGACPKRPTEQLIGLPDDDAEEGDEGDEGDDAEEGDEGDEGDDAEEGDDEEDAEEDDDDEMGAVNRQCRQCGSLFPERRYLLIHARNTDHDIDG